MDHYKKRVDKWQIGRKKPASQWAKSWRPFLAKSCPLRVESGPYGETGRHHVLLRRTAVLRALKVRSQIFDTTPSRILEAGVLDHQHVTTGVFTRLIVTRLVPKD